MIGVIDIGSNSVRLMLWADGKTLYKRVLTTRLGKGMENRRLAQPCMARSAEAVSLFYHEAVKAGAERVFAFATAAVRTAENKEEFLKQVKDLTRLDVDVVSGKEEAELASFGALGTGDGVVTDVGGASSEIVWKRAGETAYAESFPVGAVTLHDRCHDDEALTQQFVGETFASLPRIESKTYAIGGTATSLACLHLQLEKYDADKVQNCYLSKEELEAIKAKLFSLTVDERKRLAGMEQNRADIIAGGACILLEIVKKIGADGVYVSDRDNLEGYLFARGLV